MFLRFEWDEAKNKSNQSKHGVWFEEVRSVFDDPKGRLFIDTDHSDDEDRFVLLGMSGMGRLLTVIHCYRESDTVVRIISARQATRREETFYAQGI